MPDWVQYQTETGEAYYYNVRSNETSWDKPPELLSEAEMEAMVADYVWVPHDKFAWVPARVMVKGYSNTSVKEVETDEPRTIDNAKLGPMISDINQVKTLISDLVQLKDVHQPSIIHLLRARFMADKFYTSVGDILVAVNPFKGTIHFTPQEMYEYSHRGGREMAPHPYTIVDDAYRDLAEANRNQSILISGESGAGKTFAVKVCLGFLSEIAGNSSGIETKIMSANPILEAFGNAKTLRNDNSSRFGKFINIDFDNQNRMAGASTANYLLEKSRIARQIKDERNFHIFYYLTSQLGADEKKALLLEDPKSYNYINKSGCYSAKTHNDKEEFADVEVGWKRMGIDPADRYSMYTLSAIVLHLGNIEFEASGDTGSKVTAGSKKHLQNAAKLMGVSDKKLESGITELITKMFTRAFNPAGAADTRDALSKALYGKAFDWLVARLNDCMCTPKSTKVKGVIGMLDIFGFEIFDINGFEQLCINFANEKLQQMFNKHTFTLEEETYKREGVPFDHVEFHDSQPLLDFLGLSVKGPNADGLFGILDEQTTVGSGTDEKFLAKVIATHKTKKEIMSDRTKSKQDFKVFHYAGEVTYKTDGFVVRNADKLYDGLVELCNSSSVPFIAALFKDSLNRYTTQGKKFLTQLRDLEVTVDATWSRYIRCIKPNQAKEPNIFESLSSLEQLKFSGVFEAVAIRKQGYPFRSTHENFYKKYRCIILKDFKTIKMPSYQAACDKLTKSLKKILGDCGELHIGKTMVLYKADMHRALQLKWLLAINDYAKAIQRRWNGMQVRKKVKELRVHQKIIAEATARRDLSRLEKVLAAADNLFFKTRAHRQGIIVRDVLIQEKNLLDSFTKLLSKDADKNYDEYASVVVTIKEWRAKDPLAFQGTVPVQIVKAYELVADRRECLVLVKQLFDSIDKKDLADSLSTAESAVAKITATKAKGAGEFCPTEEKDTKKLLEQLQKEKSLIEKLSAEMKTNEPRGKKRELQTKHMNSKPLDDAIKNAKDAGVKCIDSKSKLEQAIVISAIRKALLIALPTDGKADSPQWLAVSNELEKATKLKIDLPEVALIRSELALRAAVDDVVAKLSASMVALQEEMLIDSVGQGEELDLRTHPDARFVSIMLQAVSTLEQVSEAQRCLENGIQQVQEEILRDGLERADFFGYGDYGKGGEAICLEARTLLQHVRVLTFQAKQQCKIREIAPMREIVMAADEILFQLDEIETLRGYLSLSVVEQLAVQKSAAMELKDYPRAVRIQIKEKDLFFDRPDRRSQYKLENYPGLKNAEEWAKRTPFRIGFKSLREGMLCWTDWAIHSSLTIIPGSSDEEKTKALKNLARNMFKNILGFMGDKKYNNIETLAAEIVSESLKYPEIRNEVYTQLMKQLRENESKCPTSKEDGWNLMLLCLAAFPPTSDFENYLELFLRDNRKDEHIRKFHQTLIGGAFTSAPTDDMIQRHRNRYSVVLPRERANFEKWNPQEPIIVVPCWKCNGQDHKGEECDGAEATGIEEKKANKGGNNKNNKNAGAATKGPAGKGAPPTSSPAFSPPPPVDDRKLVKASYDYDSGDADDLVFSAGDILEVLDDSDPDWFVCRHEKGGKQGQTPSNFVVEYIPPKPIVTRSPPPPQSTIKTPPPQMSPPSSSSQPKGPSSNARPPPMSSAPPSTSSVRPPPMQSLARPPPMSSSVPSPRGPPMMGRPPALSSPPPAPVPTVTTTSRPPPMSNARPPPMQSPPPMSSNARGPPMSSARPPPMQSPPPMSARPPPAKVEPPKPKAQALYDYDAADDTEISFTAGEILTIIDADDDPDWPIAKNSKGEQGMVPSNFIEML